MNIRDIIRQYFSRRFSRPVQDSFGWWLVNEDSQQEKDEAMHEVWDSLTGEGYLDQTLEDLDKVHGQMRDSEKYKSRRVLRYAAAIAVLLIPSFITYFAVSHHYASLQDNIHMVQVTVPNGQQRHIILPDGTKAIVDAGSTLLYPDQFAEGKRLVYLVGQAGFDVSHDADHPFVVNTHRLSVMALGTKFGVTAWSESSLVATVLKEGRTRVTINDVDGKSTDEHYEMTPDQYFVFNTADGRHQLTHVDASSKLAWENGNMVFEDASIKDIISTIERRYGVKVYSDGISSMTGSYHIKFDSTETLAGVLDVLRGIDSGLSYRVKGKSVFIKYTKK